LVELRRRRRWRRVSAVHGEGGRPSIRTRTADGFAAGARVRKPGQVASLESTHDGAEGGKTLRRAFLVRSTDTSMSGAHCYNNLSRAPLVCRLLGTTPEVEPELISGA